MRILKKIIFRMNNLFLVVGIFLGFFGHLYFDAYIDKMNDKKNYIIEHYLGKPIFEVDGKTWTTTSLPLNSQIDFDNLESNIYSARKSLYEQAALKVALANDLGKQNSYDEVRNISDLIKIVHPEEAEVKKYYDETLQKYGDVVFAGQSFEVLKNQLSLQMLNKKISDISTAKLIEYVNKKRIKVLIENPVQEVISSDISKFPTRGNLKSNITLIHVFDYEDPKSTESNVRIESLAKKFSNQIKFVNIPIAKSVSGMGAAFAKGAFCAQEIGNKEYFEYHNRIILMSIEKLKANYNSSVVQIAQSLNLVTPKFLNCLKSDKTNEFVLDSRNNFISSPQFHGTSSIYINRKLIHTSLNELEYALKKQMY
ncbi:hypothetical protein [Fluviispira multicolorata]|uniref:Uncharacterized protein n=1 Tax=Fluviispira multicolorata TaxID=2654512 RepID=A0A833JHW2_9BACT|nr:hypothetical protein [Fluviispira multicolorata]KAB8033733.1 hypothetical protein GCL57_03225 [Fluviispira multicolorata]